MVKIFLKHIVLMTWVIFAWARPTFANFEIPPVLKDWPFRAGEILRFQVKWNGLPVGRTELIFWGLVNYQGEQVYKITSEGKTIKYEGIDTIYVDTDTFSPIEVQRDLTYMGKKEKIREYYDHQKNEVTIRKTIGDQVIEKVLKKDHSITNSIILYYLVRLQDLSDSKRFLVTLPTKEYIFQVKEGKKVANQKTWIYRSEPRGVRIWMSQKWSHIPLKMVFTKPFSVVTMIFQEVEYMDLK